MSEEFTHDVPVRFRDLDPMNHVNHAVYATYLETARTTYLDEVLGLAFEDLSFVIANLEIDYVRPILADHEPTVALRVERLGSSSIITSYEIRVDDEVAATAETTMVHVDPDAGSSAPLPDEARDAIREYHGLEAAA